MISMLDGFAKYSSVVNTVPLPRQPFWRRLLGLKRPAGTATVHFKFVSAKGEWQSIEAFAEYPEGMDAIKLSLHTFIDGSPLYFSPPKISGD